MAFLAHGKFELFGSTTTLSATERRLTSNGSFHDVGFKIGKLCNHGSQWTERASRRSIFIAPDGRSKPSNTTRSQPIARPRRTERHYLCRLFAPELHRYSQGAAAVQVLLCHLALAFAPSLFWASPLSGSLVGYAAATPLFFPLDGASAVCIFFAISGYVLTPLFIRSRATDFAHIFSRFIRLGVPALAGCAIAVIAFQMFAKYNQIAGFSNEWLASAWRPSTDLWFVKDALVNGIFVGFYGDSVAQWFGLVPSPSPRSDSYLGVLWTLSIEFYGSILILILARARSWILIVIASILFSRSYFLCFVVGHAAARAGLGEKPPVIQWPMAAAIAIFGATLCMTSHYWTPSLVSTVCAASSRIFPPCPTMDNGYLMRIYGATVFTIAVMQCAPARALLGHEKLRALGRLSFSLYLMHWPVVFGVGSLLLVEVNHMAGLKVARAVTIVVCAVLAIFAATAFERVDQLALRISRAVRG